MANIDTLGEFRRYTPKELAEIDGRLRDAEQSIENSFTGLDIKRVKRVKKSKENMEAELDAIKTTPMKDANGKPIKDAKNRTLTLMDVLAKRGLTAIKLPDDTTQTLMIEAAKSQEAQTEEAQTEEAQTEAAPEEEPKAEEITQTEEEEEEIKEDIPLYEHIPIKNKLILSYEQDNYNIGKGKSKWSDIKITYKKHEKVYNKVNYTAAHVLETVLKQRVIVEINKNVRDLILQIIQDFKEYMKLPFKIRIHNFTYLVREGENIEQLPFSDEQEGTGIRRRYKGHSKAPQNKPLTIQIIDETKGKLGNKYINMAQLLYYKHLIISDIDGNKFYDASISPGLLKLLTKKTVAPNRNNKYIDKDLKEFAKILRICDVIPTAAEKRSAKWRLIEDITEPAKFNTRARLEEETDKMLGEGLNTDSFDDNIEYISRGIQARNAGNSSKYLKQATIKKISKLFGNGIINSDEKYNLLEQLN